MKKQFIQSWLVYMALTVVFLAVLVNIFRPVLEIMDVHALKMEALVMMAVLLVMVLIGFSLIMALARVGRQKLTESAIATQLEAMSQGKFQQMKSGEKDSWMSPLYTLHLENFYQQTVQLAKKQEQLSNQLQELASQPQYVGEETKEAIIETERHRIARELHDSVSQQLFAAMMMLSALSEQKEQLSVTMQKQLTLIEKVINDSQSEMRALLLHLRPISLENKTLKQGIESLLRELQTKVQMKLQWDLDDVTLLPGIEDHLFRITQELLSNALRHAKATTLEVYLKSDLDQVTLRVMDDGVGFDPDIEKAGSYGLTNMRERVKSMGGTLKIISFPQQGAIIDIKIPKIQPTEDTHD